MSMLDLNLGGNDREKNAIERSEASLAEARKKPMSWAMTALKFYLADQALNNGKFTDAINTKGAAMKGKIDEWLGLGADGGGGSQMGFGDAMSLASSNPERYQIVTEDPFLSLDLGRL